MGKILSPFTLLFRYHKTKIVTILLIAFVFAVLLIPNDDIADWLTAQIAQKSNSMVYAQFDNLSFDVIPSPGVSASDLLVDSKGFPAIKAGEVHAATLLGKLLTFKLGISLMADRIFHGAVGVSYAQGDKTSSGQNYDDITVDATKISLDDLGEFLRKSNLLSLKLQGVANLSANLHLDRTMTAQPSLSTSLDVASMTIPAQSVMLNQNGVMAAQDIPLIELGRVAIKNAKLNEGILDLSEITIGDPKSDLYGKIRGSMNLVFRKSPTGMQPEIKGVDLAIDLNYSTGFTDRYSKTILGMVVILIPANLQTKTSTGTHAAFHLKLANPNDFPTFTPLTEKM